MTDTPAWFQNLPMSPQGPESGPFSKDRAQVRATSPVGEDVEGASCVRSSTTIVASMTRCGRPPS